MAVMLECDVLKSARERLGLSACQVAARANISVRQYQRFESGERNLSSSSFAIARRILEALELDVNSFGKVKGDAPGEPVIEYQQQIESVYASSCEIFKDKICVFIGRFERCSKQEAQDRVFAVGGIPHNCITAFVSFVISGRVSESSKVYEEAKRYENHGVLTILCEQEFFDTLDGKYMPPEIADRPKEGIRTPNIYALLNKKRAAYLASKKILGTDGNLLDARSEAAVQYFVQKYMHTALSDQVRRHYKIIANELEQGAELLIDMANSPAECNNKILTSDQKKAVVYAESFLKSFDDCKCPVKLRKRRNSALNEHRTDKSRWMKAAAAEIQRKLDEEREDDFWNERNPIFLHH
ncbi:MAG: helix-turn-helix domain-containing protein [Clostridiales bacterium]|nr:helix-turn-helix domain-containing protein [Clostridiales bacterium]